MLEYNEEEKRLTINVDYKALLHCWLWAVLLTFLIGLFTANILLMVYCTYPVIMMIAIYSLHVKSIQDKFKKLFASLRQKASPDGEKEGT